MRLSHSTPYPRSRAGGETRCRVERLEGRTLFDLVPITPILPGILDVGDTYATALDLGRVDGGKVFANSVGSNDTRDVYAFGVGKSSRVTLNLTGLKAYNVDLQVFDRFGNQVAGGLANAPGTASEKLTLLLPPFVTYYAKVKWAGPVSPPKAVSTTYTLTLTGEDKAGNDLTTAQDLGDVTNKKIRRIESVGAGDAIDYYKVTISDYQVFNVDVKRLTADADVEFLTNTGSPLLPSVISAHAGTADESLYFGVHAGTYFLKVFSAGGDTNYDLTIQAKFF